MGLWPGFPRAAHRLHPLQCAMNAVRFVSRLLSSAAAAAAAALATGCIDAPVGDCPEQGSNSPIDVYVNDVPAGVQASAFDVTAVGSKGDEPALEGSLGPGFVYFSGTGGDSQERYLVTVTYEREVLYRAEVGWGVSSCGFAANAQFGADAGAPQGASENDAGN
jgi:hypothetical protein